MDNNTVEYNTITNPHNTDIVREEIRVLLQSIFLKPFVWGTFDCENDELKFAVVVTMDHECRQKLIDTFKERSYYILEIPAQCTKPIDLVIDKVKDLFGSYLRGEWLDKNDFVLSEVRKAKSISSEDFDYEDYYSNWLSNRLVLHEHDVFQRIKHVAEMEGIDIGTYLKQDMLSRNLLLKDNKTPDTQKRHNDMNKRDDLSNLTNHSDTPNCSDISNKNILSRAIDEFLYLHNEYKSNVQFKLVGYNVYGDTMIKIWMDETGTNFILYNPKAVNRYFHILEKVSEVVDMLKEIGVYKLACPEKELSCDNLHEMLMWYSENRIYPVEKMSGLYSGVLD